MQVSGKRALGERNVIIVNVIVNVIVIISIVISDDGDDPSPSSAAEMEESFWESNDSWKTF